MINKKLNAIFTTFVVYNPKIEGVRDKNDGDTHIMPIFSKKVYLLDLNISF